MVGGGDTIMATAHLALELGAVFFVEIAFGRGNTPTWWCQWCLWVEVLFYRGVPIPILFGGSDHAREGYGVGRAEDSDEASILICTQARRTRGDNTVFVSAIFSHVQKTKK